MHVAVQVKVIVKMRVVRMTKRERNLRSPVRKRREKLVIGQRKGKPHEMFNVEFCSTGLSLKAGGGGIPSTTTTSSTLKKKKKKKKKKPGLKPRLL